MIPAVHNPIVVVLLPVFVLPSCFTFGVWNASQQVAGIERQDGEVRAVPSPTAVRFFVAADLLPGSWPQAERADRPWLAIEPLDGHADLERLLADVAAGRLQQARCGITLSAASATRVRLHLDAVGADGAADSYREVDCDGSWQWCETAAPGLGLIGAVRIVTSSDSLPIWQRVVMTPFTAVLDLATSPLQLLLVPMWLGYP